MPANGGRCQRQSPVLPGTSSASGRTHGSAGSAPRRGRWLLMVDKEVVTVMEQVEEAVEVREEVAEVRKKAWRWAQRRSWRSCRGGTRRRSTRRSWERWAVAGRGGLDCAAGEEEYYLIFLSVPPAGDPVPTPVSTNGRAHGH